MSVKESKNRLRVPGCQANVKQFKFAFSCISLLLYILHGETKPLRKLQCLLNIGLKSLTLEWLPT